MIEILLALAVLSFLALPLFLFMRTGSRGVQGTRDVAAAAFLASQALESLRAWPYEQLEPGGGAPPGPGGSPSPSAEEVYARPENRDLKMGGLPFTRTVAIEPLGGPGGPTGKLVKVRVEWPGKGAPRLYEVTTVVGRGP